MLGSAQTGPNDRGRTYPHGTLTADTLGKCRCPHCKTAFATYRAQRRAVGKDDPRGTHIVHTDGHIPRRWLHHHAHASWLLAGGADIQTVNERLGHTSLRITEKYLHTLPDTDNTHSTHSNASATVLPIDLQVVAGAH